MKNLTTKQRIAMYFILTGKVIALTSPVWLTAACTEYITEYVYLKNYGQIYAFGTNILVTGDMGVENFEDTKHRLQSLMTFLDSNTNPGSIRTKLITTLTNEGFNITLKTDSEDCKIDNGILTINASYLFSGDDTSIAINIRDTMCNENIAKAMPVDSKENASDTIRMAKAPTSAKTFAKSVVAQLPQSRGKGV